MKTRELNKKLQVNKRTISNLEMKEIMGGAETDWEPTASEIDNTCQPPFCIKPSVEQTRVDSGCGWCDSMFWDE